MSCSKWQNCVIIQLKTTSWKNMGNHRSSLFPVLCYSRAQSITYLAHWIKIGFNCQFYTEIIFCTLLASRKRIFWLLCVWSGILFLFREYNRLTCVLNMEEGQVTLNSFVIYDISNSSRVISCGMYRIAFIYFSSTFEHLFLHDSILLINYSLFVKFYLLITYCSWSFKIS